MTNEDYQLEELENAAVNKSNDAKRMAAIAAGLVGSAGVATAATYGATVGYGEGEEAQLTEQLTQDDVDSAAEAGADQVPDAEPVPEPAPQPTPQPTPQPNPDPDLQYNKTTHYYDEDNNLLGTSEEGTVDGKDFMLLDSDNDGKADVVAIDVNGNGQYDSDEIAYLEGNEQVAMGHATAVHDDKFLAVADPEPEPEPYYDDKDYDDGLAYEDYNDEKSGEEYADDYAENNDNYQNDVDVDHYSASAEGDYAYDNYKEDTEYEEEDYSLASDDSDSSSADDLGVDDGFDLV